MPPTDGIRSYESAAILSIGDELTLGQSLDTNSRWLSDRLLSLGIVTREHATVPDDLTAIADAFSRLSGAHDLVICSGGLGPTADDLTRQALARATLDTLIEDPVSLAQIRAWFAGRGREMPEINAVQALRPSRAMAIPNAHGTAPGMQAAIQRPPPARAGADCFCLPGPPREMMPMFEGWVAPRLAPPAGRTVITRVLHTMGLGESDIAMRLGRLMDRDASPMVGTTASMGMVSVRIRYEGNATSDEGRRIVDVAELAVRGAVGDYIVCDEGTTLAAAVLTALRAKGDTLAVVESCTGGLLGAIITETPGASDVFVGGVITYSNQLKIAQVGVPGDVLDRFGAVSPETASAMACGGMERTGASHCLAITGIAGPGGGTDDKPVGTVYIALASRDAAVDARLFRMAGDRASIREWSAKSALAMLWYNLAGRRDMALLRQVAIR